MQNAADFNGNPTNKPTCQTPNVGSPSFRLLRPASRTPAPNPVPQASHPGRFTPRTGRPASDARRARERARKNQALKKHDRKTPTFAELSQRVEPKLVKVDLDAKELRPCAGAFTGRHQEEGEGVQTLSEFLGEDSCRWVLDWDGRFVL